MRSLTFLFLTFVHFSLYGQEEVTITINSDSLEEIFSKEKIKRKNFKLLGLDYDYFVNPNEEYNTTDMQHPKIPRCQLIVCLKDQTIYFVFYECGSIYGELIQCRIGLKEKGQFKLYELIEKIEDREDLVTLINSKTLRVRRIDGKN